MKDKKNQDVENEHEQESAPIESVDATEKNTCDHCDEYILGWKRALADYDNLKKDLAGERQRMREFVTEDAINRILPVLDNFDAALAFKPGGLDAKVENWLQGLLYVRTQLETVVSEFGATPFAQVGEAFDPTFHDAGAEKEVEGREPGVIVEVARRGWKRGDRIIRPAKVIISK